MIGKHISVSETLTPLDEEGQLILILISERIVKTRKIKLRRRNINEYLVQWKDFDSREATWEYEQIL